MPPKFNWLRKGSLYGLNIGILAFLFFVGSVVLYGPRNVRGQGSIIIPDDSLVYEAKPLDLNLSKLGDRWTLGFRGEGKVYLVKSDTEVLSNATVQLEVPTLNFRTAVPEVSSGVYSLSLPENLIITPQVEAVTPEELSDLQIQPLEYSLTVNDRTNSAALNVSPVKISTLETGVDVSFKTGLLQSRVVDYVPAAGIAALPTAPNTYQIFVRAAFRAKVLDINGLPLAHRTLSVVLEIPNHSYSEMVSVTTDADGIFSYSRSELAFLNISGGQILSLGSPLQIEGTSFPVMLLNWGGAGEEILRQLKEALLTLLDLINGGVPPSGSGNDAGKDPINLTTGNFYHLHQDLYIPGKGEPINFTRAYNSRDSYQGPLGYGWTHSYNVFLEPEADGDIRERDEDGTLIIFSKNPDGSYSSPAGNHDHLTRNPDGTFTLRKKHGTVYRFNAARKLASIVDSNDNQTILTYTGNKFTAITDASGRTATLQYDGSGRIIRLTDPLGRATAYAYDTVNNLIFATDPIGGRTEYSYSEPRYVEDDHNLSQITDARGNHILVEYDEEHRATSFSYDAKNHEVILSYDPASNRTTVTDSKGSDSIHTYTTISDIRLVTEVLDPQAHTQLQSWDSDLNKISSTDQNSHAAAMTYDDVGNLTGITDPLANLTFFAYEPAFNKVTSIMDPLGRATSYTYDASGNLAGVTDAKSNTTEYSYDIFGNLTSTTDANGNRTGYEYDFHGNVIRITDPLGNQTQFSYDLVGNTTAITDARGNSTTFTYDGLDRLTQITYPDATAIKYGYDAVGNRTSITDPKSLVTKYDYDVANRLFQVIDPLGGKTNYGYDTEGNQVGITDANRESTRYGYDNLNRLFETLTPLLKRAQFSYDPAGNRLSSKDANGNTINYSYDAGNRLTQITYPDASLVSFTYDAAGRRISMTDPQGVTTYAYDELNQLTSVDGPGLGNTISYSYDNVGNRTRMVDQDGGVTTYAYDLLNRLTNVTDPEGRTAAYHYDQVSNLTQMDYPNFTQAVYGYDNLNRLVNLTNRPTNAIHKEKHNISSYSYDYDPMGMRTKVSLERGDYILYSYDALNRLTKEVKMKGDSGRTFYTYSYAYDAVGNRTSMHRRLHQRMTSAGKGAKSSGGVSPGLGMEDLPGNNYYTYSYNRDNQLVAAGIKRSARTSVPPSGLAVPGTFDADEILVKFKPGTDESTIASINAKHGAAVSKKIEKIGVLKLKLASGVDPAAVRAAYASDPSVEFAEPNFAVRALLTPNDPNLTEQWALHNTGQTGGIPDSDIDAPEAWDFENGDPAILTAVVDTGVDLDHPDLAGRILQGRDFVNDDNDAQDDNGHGTFMAGVIAALTHNGVGMAGVTWFGQILPVKVLDSGGGGFIADVADGIIFAADNGADIINLSLGTSDNSLTLGNAVKYAFDKGSVLVAAVGNENGPVVYPAAYDPYVLGVAATDHNDQRASFSNFGPEVDVAAPGVSIFSTYFNDTYLIASGTSASAPFVSGVAGLVLSQDPALTPDQLMQRIKSTSQDVNQGSFPGEDDYLGSGRVNAFNALTITPPSEEVFNATIAYTYDSNGNQVTRTIHKAKGNPQAFSYSYDHENRLTRITYPDSTSSHYTYDGLGKRIMTSEQGQLTHFLYDGLTSILERNQSGATQAAYARGLGYGGGIGSIISRQSTVGSPQYYHYDGIGAVTGLTDSTSNSIQSYTYDAFGNILEAKGGVNNPYQFSTKEYHPASGLTYFGARYYDPRIGRFITKDPYTWAPDDVRFLGGHSGLSLLFAEGIVKNKGVIDPDGIISFSDEFREALKTAIFLFGARSPQSQHRFVYVFNNPVNLVDPWGLSKQKGFQKGEVDKMQKILELLSGIKDPLPPVRKTVIKEINRGIDTLEEAVEERNRELQELYETFKTRRP